MKKNAKISISKSLFHVYVNKTSNAILFDNRWLDPFCFSFSSCVMNFGLMTQKLFIDIISNVKLKLNSLCELLLFFVAVLLSFLFALAASACLYFSLVYLRLNYFISFYFDPDIGKMCKNKRKRIFKSQMCFTCHRKSFSLIRNVYKLVHLSYVQCFVFIILIAEMCVLCN